MSGEACKKCGKPCEGGSIECTEDHELVVVDEQIQEAIILNKGDHLCDACNKVVTYYRRIRY